MVEQQPTFTTDLCYEANDLRLMQAGIVCVEGVAGFTHLAVTETSPASGDVAVSAGHLFFPPQYDSVPFGQYHVVSIAEVLLEVPLNSTGSDRTDVVWAQVCDPDFPPPGAGSFQLVYEENNPTAIEPADGCTWHILAKVVVPNGAGTGGTDITGVPAYFGDTDGMIQDARSAFQMCGDGSGWTEVDAALDFPAIGAGLAESLTVTVPGAAVGDPVAVGCSIGAFSSQLLWSAFVSAADTVTCRVFNPTGGSLNPPLSGWSVAVKIR